VFQLSKYRELPLSHWLDECKEIHKGFITGDLPSANCRPAKQKKLTQCYSRAPSCPEIPEISQLS